MIFNSLSKNKIPDVLPKNMQEEIEKLKKAQTKEECLQKAYDFLSQKYNGDRTKTLIKLPYLFITDIKKLWGKNGFLHCTNINYLLIIFLLRSNFFVKSDIEVKWTLIFYISPHQYLRIKINEGKYINIDIWGKIYGIKFGNYTRGFNSSFLKKN